MKIEIKEKWMVEHLPHLDSVGFHRGSALCSSRKQAEELIENIATTVAGATIETSKKPMQYRISKGAFRIRKIKVWEMLSK